MDTKFWFSQNLRLIVHKLDEPIDGKQFQITYLDGKPFANAGALIRNFKNCTIFWERCMAKEEFDARVAAFDFKRTPEYRERVRSREAEKLEMLHAASTEKLAKLQEKYEVIPVTEDNIKIVIQFLGSQNWGYWHLPKMAIGYSADQYDCDGNTVTTMKFDRPILVDGIEYRKFVIHTRRCSHCNCFFNHLSLRWG